MIIKSKAYARAALIGNPSDGYFGKTISFTFDNFAATVTLYESPELEILPTRREAPSSPASTTSPGTSSSSATTAASGC